MPQFESAYGDALKKQGEREIDKRLYDVIWGEAAGGSPQEIAAVASVFLNRAESQGYEKALKGSSAYRKKSPQYMKAMSGKLNVTESILYQKYKEIVDTLVAKPEMIAPYTHMENINAFGEPSWAKDMKEYKDIGRQRFYTGR